MSPWTSKRDASGSTGLAGAPSARTMLDVATRWAVSAAVTVYLRALICDLYILTGVRYYAGRSSVGTAVLLQREVMSLSPDVRGDPERAVMFGGWYPPIFTFDDRKVRDLYVLGD